MIIPTSLPLVLVAAGAEGCMDMTKSVCVTLSLGWLVRADFPEDFKRCLLAYGKRGWVKIRCWVAGPLAVRTVISGLISKTTMNRLSLSKQSHLIIRATFVPLPCHETLRASRD
jgi:hypothetical protein